MLDNVAVTFSMVDAETGLLTIANTAANIEYKRLREEYPNQIIFVLTYKFKEHETSKPGRYNAEYVLDFLGENSCGKIKFPIDEEINVVISDSITKTSVI